MELQNIMSTHVHVVSPEESVSTAALKMRDADVGCLVVSDDEGIKGMLTDRDLAVGCLGNRHDSTGCQVSDHMTAPAITVAPGLDMVNAAHLMTVKNIRRLPVVRLGELVGLVSLSDIALALDMAKQSMDKTMHDLLMGMGASRSA